MTFDEWFAVSQHLGNVASRAAARDAWYAAMGERIEMGAATLARLGWKNHQPEPVCIVLTGAPYPTRHAEAAATIGGVTITSTANNQAEAIGACVRQLVKSGMLPGLVLEEGPAPAGPLVAIRSVFVTPQPFEETVLVGMDYVGFELSAEPRYLDTDEGRRALGERLRKAIEEHDAALKAARTNHPINPSEEP